MNHCSCSFVSGVADDSDRLQCGSGQRQHRRFHRYIHGTKKTRVVSRQRRRRVRCCCSIDAGCLICGCIPSITLIIKMITLDFVLNPIFFSLCFFYFTNDLPDHHAHRDQHTRFCPTPLLQVPHSMGAPLHKPRQHCLCALFSICQCYRRHDGSDQYVKSLLYMLVVLVV